MTGFRSRLLGSVVLTDQKGGGGAKTKIHTYGLWIGLKIATQ